MVWYGMIAQGVGPPAAPVEGPGEVVAGAEGDDGGGGLALPPGHLVYLGEHPAHRAVSPAGWGQGEVVGAGY